MVRAVVNVEQGRAVLLAFRAQKRMDLRNVLVGVESLGQTALVGDEHNLKPCVMCRPERVHHGGKDGEFGQALGVVSGIVVDHTVAVEEEAGSQAHGAKVLRPRSRAAMPKKERSQ